MPDQLPTAHIGRSILSHCACWLLNMPLSRLLRMNRRRLVRGGVGVVLVGAAEHVMRHMGGKPADDEARAENTAVIEDVAILIGRALPRHDAGERWRLEVGPPPLRAGGGP